MDRIEYDHTKLEGNDADIETSLKEYGIAWIETDTEYLFYYGVGYGPEEDAFGCIDDCYIKFDFCSLSKDMDIKSEYDWVNWNDIDDFVGMEFDKMPFTQKISDLVRYYGPDNIFGACYWDGLTYNEIVKDGDR